MVWALHFAVLADPQCDLSDVRCLAGQTGSERLLHARFVHGAGLAAGGELVELATLLDPEEHAVRAAISMNMRESRRIVIRPHGVVCTRAWLGI